MPGGSPRIIAEIRWHPRHGITFDRSFLSPPINAPLDSVLMPHLPPSTLCLLVLMLLIGCATPDFPVEYEEGQVWHYDTREGEAGSRLYIARVDELPTGARIYHVSIDGVAVRNPQADGGVWTVLPHAPVGRETLDASVTELVHEGAEMPDISEGYTAWLEASGAGFFTVSVAAIPDLIEQAVAGR
jgi:hypothetical protein